MRWAQLTVSAECGAIDAVGHCLNEIGCNGFVIEDEVAPSRLSGYLPVDDRLELRLEQLGDRLVALGSHGISGAGVDITIRYVDEEDWANAWKAFFKPMRIGNRLVVTPPWESPPALPDDVTMIDPGMAFGTGSHPTTRLCLAAIEEFLNPGTNVADIGCGSGILGIAAAKLGAASVHACDIDLLAVRIARENACANGVDIDLSEAIPSGTFDLIVANIMADVIIDMADDLVARLASDGILIVSGIIDIRGADVVEALDARGLSCVEVRYEGEWVALVCVFDERR